MNWKILISIIILINIFCLQTLPGTSIKLNKNLFEEDDGVEHWAIIVGPYEEPISIFEMYAEMTKYILCNQGFNESHIKLLAGKQATYENIIKAFSWLKDREDANDTVLIWLIDHGQQHGFSLYNSRLSYEELNTILNMLDSNNIAIIIDACYSGGAIPILSKEGRIIITSCKSNQTSGSITNICLCALQGYGDYLGNKDGIVSIEEMFDFLKKHESGFNDYSPQIDNKIFGDLRIINIDRSDRNPDQFQNLFFGRNCAVDKGLAQSFQPTKNKINKVKLFLHKKGHPGLLRISIRENLSGENLITLMIPEENILPCWTYPSISYDFYFPELHVIPDKLYYIVCENQEVDVENRYYWANTIGGNGEYFDGYERGSAYINHSGRWINYEMDFCFATFSEQNLPPSIPNIDGPKRGRAFKENKFSTETSDPENDQIYYWFDWGDNNYSGWLGPFDSGEIVEAKYSWNIKSIYEIKVKAKDIYGDESGWSEPHIITINWHSAWLLGEISNIQCQDNSIVFSAEFVLYLSLKPIKFSIYSSGETFIIYKEYTGLIRPKFIFGWFNIRNILQ